MHRSDAYSSTSYSRGIRWLPSSELCRIAPFGRYPELRMPMEPRCSSKVFQRELVTRFGDFEGVEIVVDDILVHGKRLEEHNMSLRNVLRKTRGIDLKLNKNKCLLAQPDVDYVGHKLTGAGLKATDKRIRAIAYTLK